MRTAGDKLSKKASKEELHTYDHCKNGKEEQWALGHSCFIKEEF